MSAMSARIESLGLIEVALWQELQRASADRQHQWRQCTLATVDGERADARLVVLREVQPQARQLMLYTDTRSPKVSQIARHPQGTLVAWSPLLNWQLRLSVVLTVSDSGLDVSSRWAQVKLSRNVQDYLAPVAPGTPLMRFEVERGSREHFAVITAKVQHIDWLELHPDGHRRARFEAGGAMWLAP